MKLSILAFGLACGLIWGVGLMMVTWWIMLFDGATAERTLVGMVYRGYNITPAGSVIGLLWAVPDGFIGGAIFAWLYNLLAGSVKTGSTA